MNRITLSQDGMADLHRALPFVRFGVALLLYVCRRNNLTSISQAFTDADSFISHLEADLR